MNCIQTYVLAVPTHSPRQEIAVDIQLVTCPHSIAPIESGLLNQTRHLKVHIHSNRQLVLAAALRNILPENDRPSRVECHGEWSKGPLLLKAQIKAWQRWCDTAAVSGTWPSSVASD